MDNSNLYFVNSDSPEWRRMWEVIKSTFGDYACECPLTGETWQYMGTENRMGGDLAVPEWAHCFRHRNLPARGERVYFRVPASKL